MKRAEALKNLSREHNHALLLARTALRAATGGDQHAMHESWCSLQRAWEVEMAAHFEIEERLVIPVLRDATRRAAAARASRHPPHRHRARALEPGAFGRPRRGSAGARTARGTRSVSADRAACRQRHHDRVGATPGRLRRPQERPGPVMTPRREIPSLGAEEKTAHDSVNPAFGGCRKGGGNCREHVR